MRMATDLRDNAVQTNKKTPPQHKTKGKHEYTQAMERLDGEISSSFESDIAIRFYPSGSR